MNVKLFVLTIMALATIGLTSCTKGGKSYAYLECVEDKDNQITAIIDKYDIQVAREYKRYETGSISINTYNRTIANYAEDMQEDIAEVNKIKCVLED